MMSASDHLANWCWVMVLPAPKGPGMAAAPPFPMGKRVSMIRCPVTRGRSMGSRWAMGRGVRMGHRWARARGWICPWSSVSSTRVSLTR